MSAGMRAAVAHQVRRLLHSHKTTLFHFAQGLTCCCCLLYSQEVRKRLHRHRQKFGKQLVMWYVLAAPDVNRKVAQGHMIRAAEQMGLRLSSNKDAAMARRK
jgi:hypothetical protein